MRSRLPPLCFALGLLSCGGRATNATGGHDGGPRGADASAPSPTVEAATRALSEAVCAAHARCDRSRLDAFDGDEEVCAARTALLYEQWLVAPETGLLPDDVATCAADYAALPCAEVRAGQWPASCHPSGARNEGASCAHDAQCRSRYCQRYTSGVDTFLCGVCAERATEGGKCRPDFSDCERGYACDAGTCRKMNDAPGEPCPCLPTLRCAAGKCAAFRDEGAPCADDPDSCDAAEDRYCDPATGTCAPRPTFEPGDRCDGFAICRGGQCLLSSLTDPVCRPWIPDGEACSVNQLGSWWCLSPAICIEGTCQVPASALCT